MIYEIKDFKLELIDEPLQSHVVAWEQAARAMQSEDAKPLLNRMLAELRKVSVADRNVNAIVGAFVLISEVLEQVIKILDDNETLTLSSNRSVYVKAAIRSGWIVSPSLTEEDVDHLKPWLVAWIAERVAALYNEVTTIPKN